MSATPEHDPIDDDLRLLGTRLRSDGERRPADLPALDGRIRAGRQRARLALSATCVLAVLVVATAVGVGASGTTESLQVGDGDSMIGGGPTPGTGPPGSDVPPGSSVTTVTVPVPADEPSGPEVALPSSVSLPEDGVTGASPGQGAAPTAAPGSDGYPVWAPENQYPDPETMSKETWALRVVHDETTALGERPIQDWLPSDPIADAVPILTGRVESNRLMQYWQGPQARQAAEAARVVVAAWPGVISVEVGRIDWSLPNECKCEVIPQALPPGGRASPPGG